MEVIVTIFAAVDLDRFHVLKTGSDVLCQLLMGSVLDNVPARSVPLVIGKPTTTPRNSKEVLIFGGKARYRPTSPTSAIRR
jgi:hypothetical protein